MKLPPYTLVDHTADLAVIVRGRDAADLFENAGRSLIHIMLGRIPEGRGKGKSIDLIGVDLCDLMVQWLGEILYLLEGDHQIATALTVLDLSATRILATAETVPFDPERHEVLTEIKAVTYHQVSVEEASDHWEARVIMDV